jgi:FHA domain
MPTGPSNGRAACPGCGWVPDASARFCESCGRDLSTGWVVEVWVDPDWHASREDRRPCPAPGPPTLVPLTGRSVLVGRPSTSRRITPEVDCADDPGVSRRQAQLSTDGRRWWVEDLRSANGTYVGPAGGPLPSDPVPPGQRRELGDEDRVYVGSWTRLALRRAGTPAPSG